MDIRGDSMPVGRAHEGTYMLPILNTHLRDWNIPFPRLFLPLLLDRVTQHFRPADTLAIQQVRRDSTVWYSVVICVLVRALLMHRDPGRGIEYVDSQNITYVAQ